MYVLLQNFKRFATRLKCVNPSAVGPQLLAGCECEQSDVGSDIKKNRFHTECVKYEIQFSPFDLEFSPNIESNFSPRMKHKFDSVNTNRNGEHPKHGVAHSK